MSSLFDSDPFELICLPKLADGLLKPADKQFGMAGFQRNAVWKEDKVEDLWDSIFCYFPIGSIMLARFEDFSEVGYRNIQISRSDSYPDTITTGEGINFIVVDGQQRLNAISLGFAPFDENDRARLWIDLIAPQPLSTRRFDFYLCTRDNPFGINPDKSPLSREQLRQAFSKIDRSNEDDTDLSLSRTYPYRARLAVPFVEFCTIIKQIDGADWEIVRNKLSSAETVGLRGKALDLFRNGLNTQVVSVEFLNEVIRVIRDIVLGNSYEVPAILIQKKDRQWMTAQKLGKLFERVNTGGVQPRPAELFFSALKLRYPPINNYIAEIYNDPQFRGLLTPTDLVLTVLRIADPTITELQLGLFEGIVEKNINKLVELTNRTQDTESEFKRCLKLAYQALHHNGEPDDIGLPREYLTTLRPRVWQTIAIWIYQYLDHICIQGITKADRLNMLRFAVLDAHNYFLKGGGGLSSFMSRPSISTGLAKQIDGRESFPNLYPSFKETLPEGYETCPLQPEAFQSWIEPGSIKPNWNQFSNENLLILYAQRHWIRRWEEKNIRLDIDHIAPSRWMYFAGRTGAGSFWKADRDIYNQRYVVMNSSGNKRFWPDSLNRSYRDSPPHLKYVNGNLEQLTDGPHTALGLGTVADILAASALDEDLAQDWSDLGCTNDNRVWTADRFANFKLMVDKRRIRLYRQMFDDLHLLDILV